MSDRPLQSTPEFRARIAEFVSFVNQLSPERMRQMIADVGWKLDIYDDRAPSLSIAEEFSVWNGEALAAAQDARVRDRESTRQYLKSTRQGGPIGPS